MGFGRVWIHAIIPVVKDAFHAITASLLDKG
jgi:hypothetical protein